MNEKTTIFKVKKMAQNDTPRKAGACTANLEPRKPQTKTVCIQTTACYCSRTFKRPRLAMLVLKRIHNLDRAQIWLE